MPNFRYGVDPLPPPPAFTFDGASAGSFGRINDPDARTRTCTSSRSASRRILRGTWVLSSDYVHTQGLLEPRVHGHQPADSRRVRSGVPRLDSHRRALRRRAPTRATSTRRSFAPGMGADRLGADQHDRHDQRIEVRLVDDDAERPDRPGDAVAQLRAGQLARVGRPADGLVQRQRHRRHARAAVRRGRMGTDAARRAPPHRRQRRLRSAARASRCRRSSSGRRRGRTRRSSASTSTATARPTSSIGCARAPASTPCSPRAATAGDSGAQPERLPAWSPVNRQRSGFVVNPDGSIEERSGGSSTSTCASPRASASAAACCASTPTSSTCSTPRTCRSRCGPSRASAASASGFLQPRVALRAGLRTAGRPAVHRVVRRAVRVLASRK